MKLVSWEFNSLRLPLIEDDQQELYCTSTALCKALGLTQNQLRQICHRHSADLFPLSVMKRHSKELVDFIKQHRIELHVTRVREDMLLWPIDEALCVALYTQSDTAARFQREVVRLIRQHAKQSSISREEYDAMIATLSGEMQELKNLVQQAASAAGSTLSAQKKVRHLHLVPE